MLLVGVIKSIGGSPCESSGCTVKHILDAGINGVPNNGGDVYFMKAVEEDMENCCYDVMYLTVSVLVNMHSGIL